MTKPPSGPPRPVRLATIKETAHLYRVSERTVHRWKAEGVLTVRQVGPRKTVLLVVPATVTSSDI